MYPVRKSKLIVLTFLLSTLLIACGQTTIEIGMTETTTPDHWHASYETFSGVKSVSTHASEGQTMSLTYDAQLNKGTLELTVESPLGETIWDVYLHENTKATVQLPLYGTGDYDIVAHGSEASGSFDITWQIQ